MLTGKTVAPKKILSKCLFFHHKSHTNCRGIEPGPPRREADDQLPEAWHGQSLGLH